MRKQPAIEGNSTGRLTVLSVSPLHEDHSSLQTIVGHSRWKLLSAHDLTAALILVQQEEISRDRCLPDSVTWQPHNKNCAGMGPEPEVFSNFGRERVVNAITGLAL